MVRLKNCKLTDATKELNGRNIIFFGCGSWLSIVDHTELMALEDNFKYIVDNKPKDNFILGSKTYEVFLPEKIREEKDGCVIIISSPVYMKEMYDQLVDMNLDTQIDCYVFPFMQMVTDNYIDASLLKKVCSLNCEQKIPKIIHSFWFSGDDKPGIYKKCIESWERTLTDYRIIEWNMDNYDWHKHPFVERAIENRAWAFASDYARLDVLREFGGFYLDMDVEVKKTFDDLLGNDAVLSFSNHVQIDLAVMGSKSQNILLDELLAIYDTLELPDDTRGFTKFFQPSLVREKLFENEIKMDGSLQKTSNATAFPAEFFQPLDYVIFAEHDFTDNCYAVHYDNFGWSFDKNSKREKKIRDNNELWKIIKNNAN